jgi:uncharacterized protein YjbI with pentapeptide repeats
MFFGQTIATTFVTIFFWYQFNFTGRLDLFKSIKNHYIEVIIFSAIFILHALLITKVIPSANEGNDLKFLKNWMLIDLRYKNLSGKPEQDIEQSYTTKNKLACNELQSGENPYSLGLEGVYLEGADLTSINLRQANLEKAHLQKAQMSKTILERANLEKANLQGAILFGANLQKGALRNSYE